MSNKFDNYYYVSSGFGWFVVACPNAKEAKTVGVAEFGRGMVNTVRRATPSEVSHFVSLKGADATRP